jgi:hypothetical protein
MLMLGPTVDAIYHQINPYCIFVMLRIDPTPTTAIGGAL